LYSLWIYLLLAIPFHRRLSRSTESSHTDIRTVPSLFSISFTEIIAYQEYPVKILYYVLTFTRTPTTLIPRAEAQPRLSYVSDPPNFHVLNK